MQNIFTNIKCSEIILYNDNENWYIILFDLFSRLCYIATCGPFCKDATHMFVAGISVKMFTAASTYFFRKGYLTLKMLYLYFKLVICFSIVHSNNRSYHFRYNNHVPQMCLDWLWFFMRLGSLLSLA